MRLSSGRAVALEQAGARDRRGLHPPEGHRGYDAPQAQLYRNQHRILAAAQAEFARHGYDGARVDAITARAKISKNLLYHHSVRRKISTSASSSAPSETLRRRRGDVPLASLDLVEAMRRLGESNFQVFIDEPDVIVMLNTENLHRGRHLAKSPIIRALYNRLSDTLRSILNQGVFRAGVNAAELYISMSGLGHFYLSNRFTVSMLFERDLKAPENLLSRKAILSTWCCRTSPTARPRASSHARPFQPLE